MNPISSTSTPSLATTLTPQQQAAEALLGGGTSALPSSATAQQEADAAVVDISGVSSGDATGVTQTLPSGATPSETEASQLVAALSAEIVGQGTAAAQTTAVLSASTAYDLLKN